MRIQAFLQKSRVLFDGAMGTMIGARGLLDAVPETLCMSHPDAIRAIHESYVAAGANVISANTFGAHPVKLGRLGLGERACELTAAAVALAVEACRQKPTDTPLTALDVGPTGELIAPLGSLDFDEAVAGYRLIAQAARDAGADVALLETFGDIAEARAAMLGVGQAGLPIMASFTFEGARMLMGGTPETAALSAMATGAAAVGLNCSQGPDAMGARLSAMRAVVPLPVFVQPNAGIPHMEDGKTVFPLSACCMAPAMEELLRLGAWGIGGCCGTSPEHIAHMAALLGAFSAPSPAYDGIERVCSQREVMPLDQAIACAEDVTADIDDIMDAEGDVLRVDMRGLPDAAVAEFLSEAQQMTKKPLLFRMQEERAALATRYYHGKTVVIS